MPTPTKMDVEHCGKRSAPPTHPGINKPLLPVFLWLTMAAFAFLLSTAVKGTPLGIHLYGQGPFLILRLLVSSAFCWGAYFWLRLPPTDVSHVRPCPVKPGAAAVAALYGSMALLFNPALPVRMPQDTWRIWDCVAGTILFVATPYLIRRINFSLSSNTVPNSGIEAVDRRQADTDDHQVQYHRRLPYRRGRAVAPHPLATRQRTSLPEHSVRLLKRRCLLAHCAIARQPSPSGEPNYRPAWLRAPQHKRVL